MPSDTAIELSAGNLCLVLNPSIGGSISKFEWLGGDAPVPILRNCNNRSENVLDAASFPLVPFVNRIRGGRFSFRGRDVQLVPNMTGDPSPLHGQGWLNAWTVERSGPSETTLSFRHKAGEWPWDYEARQEIRLDERRLSIQLTCRNSSSEPMPCGLGQHPYFNCGRATRIHTEVTHAWTIDDDVLPVEKVPATGRFDLRDRLVCAQGLDHGFAGWGGAVTIQDPDRPFVVRMSSPDARFFQLYSPAEGGIFVAEPVSHANAALNAPEAEWTDLGMRVLQPGEAMSLGMSIAIEAG